MKLELFAKLHEINPDLKIYDLGMYFSYPYIDEKCIHYYAMLK